MCCGQAKEQLARDLKIMEDKMLHGQAMSSAQQEEAVRSMVLRVYRQHGAESVWYGVCCVPRVHCMAYAESTRCIQIVLCVACGVQ